MPYTPPPPTTDKVGAYYDNGQPSYWIDADGKPYNYVTINGTPDYSKKSYISPAALKPNTGDGFDKAKEWGMPEGQSFLHQHAQWNSEKGKWEQPINWSNIMAAGTGAAIAAPAVIGALGAGAGGAGAAGGGAAGGGAAATTIPTMSLAGGVAGGAGAIAPEVAFGTAGATAAAAAPAAATLASTTSPFASTAVAPSAVTVPGAGATPFANLAGGKLATGTDWGKVLQEGGRSLTDAAKGSADEDAANNAQSAAWLRAMNDDYRTKMGAAINVPAGLQRQALWSDYGATAKTSNPNAPSTGLLTPTQQAMMAAQKEEILKKLKVANEMALPTAPETPKFQAPGAGTKALSTLGTVANVASKVPWSKVISYF